MTLSVYLAASSGEMPRAQHWYEQLVAAGIRVTSTWLAVVAATPGGANPTDATREARRGWSQTDLAEVTAATMVWFLVPPIDKPTRGAWVEAGYAMGYGKRVVFSGMTRQSVFCALGEEYADDRDAFAAIAMRAGLAELATAEPVPVGREAIDARFDLTATMDGE